MMNTLIRELRPDDVAACAQVLEALPDWFGMEESNREYIEGLSHRPSAVAEVDGQVTGFVSIERHNPVSAEIHVLAVEPQRHRQGIGGSLVAWSEAWCRERRTPWLHVKTRGPSTPDPGYERTPLFYLAHGFEPLFETLDLWGPENAALILVKRAE